MTNSSIIEVLSSSARLAANAARADELAQALWLSYLINTREKDNNAIYILTAANLITVIAKDQGLEKEKVLFFFQENLKALLKEPTP